MKRATLTIAGACAGLVLIAAAAQAYSPEVRRNCIGDYQNYCAQYAPGTKEVRKCFERNRKALSKGCKSALLAAGEVPKKYVRK